MAEAAPRVLPPARISGALYLRCISLYLGSIYAVSRQYLRVSNFGSGWTGVERRALGALGALARLSRCLSLLDILNFIIVAERSNWTGADGLRGVSACSLLFRFSSSNSISACT